MEMDLVLQVATHRHPGQRDERLDDDQIRRLVMIHGNDKTHGPLAVIEVAMCERLDILD
jgi:hypothetical protein